MNTGQDIRYGQTAVYGQYSGWPGYLGRVTVNPDLRVKVWGGPLLGNYDLTELGMFLLDETLIGVSPSVKMEEVTIPGKHGAFLQGTKLGDRIFELSLALDPNRDLELGYEEKVSRFLVLRDRIAGMLNSIRDKATLIFAEDPSRSYQVFWRDVSGLQEYIDSGILTIPLVARPEITGVSEITHEIPSGTQYTIEYSGNRSVLPKITVTTPKQVTIQINGVLTTLRAVSRTDLSAYIETTVDGSDLSITSTYVEGSVPDLDRLCGVFPELNPGTNIIKSSTPLTLAYKELWVD